MDQRKRLSDQKMDVPKAEDVKRGISMIWENLQCPICLDVMSMPVSTKCDHQFCKFCMMKLLDRSKKKEASCPVCKMKVTKRSLQESPGFQKLVEGLQHMVQAYEYDTCTNYFTGMSQMRRRASCEETGPEEHQCNGENVSSGDGLAEGPEANAVPLSLSMAVKDAFAQLMGLEDSCPASSDNEGFDSGLGDLPPASEQEIDHCKTSAFPSEKPEQAEKSETPERVVLRSRRETRSSHLLTHQTNGPGEEGNKAERRSSRTAKRLGLDPDGIIEHRQKKSVEKVSEWLLKISPSEDTQTEDGSNTNLKRSVLPGSDDRVPDGGSCSSCSSSAATEENPANREPETSPKREEATRRLEEQVFGAVYRRERKCAGAQLERSLSPERGTAVDPPAPVQMEEETQIPKSTAKRRVSSMLTPADFIKRPRSEEKEQRALKDPVSLGELGESAPGDHSKESDAEDVIDLTEEPDLDEHGEERLSSPDKQWQESDELLEEKKEVEGEDLEHSPVFEVSVNRSGRRAKAKMQDAWQDLDQNLSAKGKGDAENKKDPKTRSSRKNWENTKKDSRLNQSKQGKATKPLVLVTAGVESCDPVEKLKSAPKLGETEVQIENYPSSEEPRTPVTRTTRRSRRLQVFTEEVQGGRKKARSTRSSKGTVSGSDARLEEHSDKADTNADEDNTNEDQANASAGCSQSGMVEKVRNGCVCNGDIGEIEKMELSEEAGAQEGKIAKENSSVAVVPNTGSPVEANTPCSSNIAADTASPPEAIVPGSPLRSIRQECPPSAATAPTPDLGVSNAAENPTRDSRSIEIEDDNNDSELDTEQLMKTFKAAKRKSFYLGSPKTGLSKRTSSDSEEDVPEGAEESCLNKSTEQGKGHELSDPVEEKSVTLAKSSLELDGKTGLGNSCGSDFVSPSNPLEHLPCEASLPRSHRNLVNPSDTSVAMVYPNLGASGESQERSLGGSSGMSESSALSPNRASKSLVQSSGLPVDSQAADSCLLFPALSASEGEQQDLGSVAPGKPQLLENSQLCVPMATDAPKESQGSHYTVQAPETCSSTGILANSDNHGNYLEASSITPDGLVPPSVDRVAGPRGEQVAGGDVKALSQPGFKQKQKQKRKRRAQKLESSESELSGEEDYLPSMAQIFRSDPSCPLPVTELEPGLIHSSRAEPCVKEPEPELIHLSQAGPCVKEPEPGAGSVCSRRDDPVQDNGCPEELVNGTAVREAGEDGRPPLSPCRDEWITSSQGSVDLFDTPEECEGPSEGIAGDTGLSMDSQYSSEIINTQQKVELQEELRRLERMMALVSEALHQKEADPGATAGMEGPKARQLPQAHRHSGSDPNTSSACEAAEGPSRESGPDSARDSASRLPGPRAPGGPGPTQPCPAQSEGPETGRLQSGRGRRSRRSGRATSQRSDISSEVKVPGVTPAASSGLTGGQEAKGSRGGTQTGRARGDAAAGGMELVASGLSANELGMVKKFSRKMGGSVSGQVTSRTTHVIIKTDGDLVCERTLKYFQGIAGRKWVVSFLWISECVSRGKVLDEAPFEVRGDVVNGHSHCGPLKARTARDHTLLMRGHEICFHGSFTDMTTGQMEWMVEMCGATVVKDPTLFTSKQKCSRLVVVQPGSGSNSDYRALWENAAVVTRSWLLDTIATYTLQDPEGYRT